MAYQDFRSKIGTIDSIFTICKDRYQFILLCEGKETYHTTLSDLVYHVLQSHKRSELNDFNKIAEFEKKQVKLIEDTLKAVKKLS